MAYLRELKAICRYPGCDRQAVVEVIDRWNSSLGQFCRSHAKRACAEQQARESKDNQAYPEY